MAKKGETIIDTKRNLCDTCKHVFPDCDGDPEFGENIGSDNIIKCDSYQKPSKKLKRVEVGKMYWWFDISLVSNNRIETGSVRDEQYSRNGNYFYTEEDCSIGIEKAKVIQQNKK